MACSAKHAIQGLIARGLGRAAQRGAGSATGFHTQCPGGWPAVCRGAPISAVALLPSAAAGGRVGALGSSVGIRCLSYFRKGSPRGSSGRGQPDNKPSPSEDDNIVPPGFTWPLGTDAAVSNDHGPIGFPEDPDLDREIVIKSDEEMEQEGIENIEKAKAWIQAKIDAGYRPQTKQETVELAQQAMEACIPPPVSWQEAIMVEEEKKRLANKTDAKTVSNHLAKAKEMAMLRIPVIDHLGRAYATGKRKTSVARVWVAPGTGNVIVNRKMMVDYFIRMALREEIFAPLRLTGKPLAWDVWCTVKGGGFTGQALAIRHGIAQALQPFDVETYRPLLKRFKYLSFDTRQVERKKPGQPKARKKFQWVKR